MSIEVCLVRKESFCASHRLYNPEFDDEKNKRIFGPCSNINGHGHNYTIEVYVEGKIDPDTGMVINLTDLKHILQKVILEHVDHSHLNFDVPFLQGIIPTTENVAKVFWEQLLPHFPGDSLKKIILYETEKNRVEVTRR